jgi:hypothetical protein
VRDGGRPNGDLETAHLSASLAHLANMATQLRRALTFDPAGEQFVGGTEANGLVGRKYRAGHWAVPKGAG